MTLTGLPDKSSLELPELPITSTLTLDPKSTALIVVDMQNDFVDPDGSLFVQAAPSTLPAIADLVERTRKSGARVVFTQDTHGPDDREFEIWPVHCVEGTWGWKIVDQLTPKPGDLILRKARYDAFYGTELEHYLSRIWKIETLIIVGTVANICVAQTAASAGLRWFDVVVPADGISALTAFDQASTLRQITSLYNGKVLGRGADLNFG
ncbi:cysteine hydrolase [Lujinxingia vulgaris]|uniref:Cysteine hydrolase n=1 Tax=Lujinxingia vulgaris TaxID=2600176 RepID=A0A5C6XAB9_9DELT|nr:isochorismatase family cysteine hydrolase [Lujinxingia vulgaris]TXD37346.1 cysteine hydrolase [Lujinxingia vulgaris]